MYRVREGAGERKEGKVCGPECDGEGWEDINEGFSFIVGHSLFVRRRPLIQQAYFLPTRV